MAEGEDNFVQQLAAQVASLKGMVSALMGEEPQGNEVQQGDSGEFAARINDARQMDNERLRGLLNEANASVERLNRETGLLRLEVDMLKRRWGAMTEGGSGGDLSASQCTTALGSVNAIRFDKPLMATLTAGVLTVSIATKNVDVVTSGSCVAGTVSLTTTNYKVIDETKVC